MTAKGLVMLTLGVYYTFSAGVDAMAAPEPDQQRKFYGWLFRFLQALCANATRLAQARFGSATIPVGIGACVSPAGAGLLERAAVERVEVAASNGGHASE